MDKDKENINDVQDGRLKLKGKLKTYLRWPLWLLVIFAVVCAGSFFIDYRAGLLALAGLIIYLSLIHIFS